MKHMIKKTTFNSNSIYDIVIINYNVIMILIILQIPSIILFILWITSSTAPELFLSAWLAAIIRILLIGMDV